MEVCEKYASRSINDSESPSAETQWYVFREASDPPNVSETDAYAALVGDPGFLTTYTFPSGLTAGLTNIAITDRDEKSWEFKVSYGVFVPKKLDDIDYEFTVGLENITAIRSLVTQAYTNTVAGRVAPNFQGGVNVDANGKPRGVDVGVGTFAFTLTKYWDTPAITQAYQLQLKALAGRYNNALFYGLPAGECQFIGARGRIQGNKWPISYSFRVGDNETNLTIGDITGINKKAWQYLDIYRRTITDGKKKIDVPHSVYVHTLPPGEGNFANIGIGT